MSLTVYLAGRDLNLQILFDYTYIIMSVVVILFSVADEFTIIFISALF